MYRPLPVSTPGFARAANPGELPAELVRQAEEAVQAAQVGRTTPTRSKLETEVAVGSLPAGVIAMIMRQGSHVTIAYSEQELNDQVFVMVDDLLSQDLTDERVVRSRTLTVMGDYSVRVTDDGSEEVRPQQLRAVRMGGGAVITSRILEGIKNQEPTHRAGIGLVRIVTEPPDAL